MLALRMYFWGAWPNPTTEEPPPVVVETPRPSAGGGGYQLDDDFWEARERYIKRMLQVVDAEIEHAPTLEQLESLDALSPQHLGSQLPVRDVGSSPYASVSLAHALELQARAVAIARLARTHAELKQAGAMIAATSRAIARLKDQHEIENLATVMVLMF